MLALLPVLTMALVVFAVRPAPGTFAPVRLALVRAGVLLGGYAAVMVELLGTARALTTAGILLCWVGAVVLAAAGAVLRYRRDGRGLADPRRALRDTWSATDRAGRIMVVGLVALMLAELVLALLSPPNNYDSQTYHLPKIEHWVVHRDVDFYATRIHRQLTIAPGAEYLLLHLRLLAGGDAWYNLLQWTAGVGTAVLVSRIAGQLGGSGRAQLLAAFVVGTTPMVVLESSSTQTDLVVAAWVGAVATLVLDGLRRRGTLAGVALLGTATGLATLTKATGLLAAGPLLVVWAVAQLRAPRPAEPSAPAEPAEPSAPAEPAGPVTVRALARVAGSALIIGGLALAIAGPYLYRVQHEYHNLLGPDYLRNSISMQRHDPAAVLINALYIGHTALDTPVTAIEAPAGAAIRGLARAVGIDPDDPQITFGGSRFPVRSWPPDEDSASFPVQGTLVLLAAGLLLLRPGRRVAPEHATVVRAYAGVFWLALLAYVALVKWQPWGNRLILFLLVLGTPLAGLWLDAVLRRRFPAGARSQAGGPSRAAGGPGRALVPAAAWTTVLVLLAGWCAGALSVGYGWPRRLVGTGSVFTTTTMQQRFQRRPQLRAEYEWAAAAVRAAGARRIGLVQGNDTWEYPWWVLLPGTDIEALQTLQADLPAATASQVDAILCVSGPAVCGYYVPPGWQLFMHDLVGYALPPAR